MRTRCTGKSVCWLAAVAAGIVLSACGSSHVVDNVYDFGAAGVTPGVNNRDAGKARLRGTVTGTTGLPAPNVPVSLYRLEATLRQAGASRQNAVGSSTTQTDALGAYVFGNVPPGNYRLIMGGQSKDVVAAADTDVVVNFQE